MGLMICILGVTNSFDNCQKVVYNIEKMINCLMKEGMSEHEALEYFDFNIAGAYVGVEHLCIFISMEVDYH
jgi:hypothetical protein